MSEVRTEESAPERAFGLRSEVCNTLVPFHGTPTQEGAWKEGHGKHVCMQTASDASTYTHTHIHGVWSLESRSGGKRPASSLDLGDQATLCAFPVRALESAIPVTPNSPPAEG